MARRAFAWFVLLFINYSVVYGVLSLFGVTPGWHFWLRSAEIASLLMFLLIFVPVLISIYVALFTNIGIDDDPE